ncbi:glycerophosphodiester phosphodiesterase family protein [Floccifex sp.]|uniref:glycerophosphodiester phosphodiesterase family protein n=1 Tax=Floccifex sp. TaxID=2815810 RepID=UPI0029FF34E5|nr:glycerophosphodiester phosphodiesterase family protein [Floccifex sp.]MDD7280555.1 glycerophosphodiester phosphodiesterase family protein [Erysipelotrichaceae bacterium]MDY2958275.1 glycerophosphodiester phosphodiesterase family protein [Floccifex sp.]
MFIVVLLIVLVLLYLWAIKPNSIRFKEKWENLESYDYAHRGLFDNKTNYPENSLPAFHRAVEHGFGIELDVQMTTDGKLVVFHDASLKRMCHVDCQLFEMSYDECQKYSLKKSNEKIPLFDDVLDVINGKVPLIIEIKAEGKPIETVKKVCERMDQYSGDYVIESFHPGVVLWLRKNRNDIIRGQLSENHYQNEKMNKPLAFVLTNFLLNGFTRPDFIAFDVRCSSFFSYRLMNKLYKFKRVAWTIKSQEQYNESKVNYECMIFDSFIPGGKDDKRI